MTLPPPIPHPGVGHTAAIVTPPASRLTPDEPVLYVARVRHLDGLPLSLDLTYLPRDIG